MLENPDFDSWNSSDEVSDLSEFSGTSFSIELTENSSQEEQDDLIYVSKKDLKAQTRKTTKNQLEQPETSKANPMV